MRASISLVAVVAAVVASVSDVCARETYEFSRYQVILDRSPFGPVTATEAQGAVPGFAAQLLLVGFVYSNSVLPQAIIEDKQGSRTYFRAEGELVNDAKVVTIDLMARKVVVQRGLEKATLTVEQRPNKPMPGGAPAQAQPPGVPAGAPFTPSPGVRRIPFRRSN
ncbi:MAG TPA: hypothetical protein VLZ12_05840 [Verrucomicrobiae bacterium]|nr:hypothetical protein [Verrucomicrobiae bacterium]